MPLDDALRYAMKPGDLRGPVPEHQHHRAFRILIPVENPFACSRLRRRLLIESHTPARLEGDELALRLLKHPCAPVRAPVGPAIGRWSAGPLSRGLRLGARSLIYDARLDLPGLGFLMIDRIESMTNAWAVCSASTAAFLISFQRSDGNTSVVRVPAPACATVCTLSTWVVWGHVPNGVKSPSSHL